MPERGTAEERLERILYLLPAAARAGGVPLEELAGRLDVDVRTLLTDVETITERSFYHPPGGSADDLQISLTPSHIQVWTTGSFRRPPKLSLREALALVIGLRMAALERESGGSGDGGDAPPLFRRLEEVLAVRSAETIEQLLMAPDLDLDAGDPRRVLLDAAERRCRCRILYLKPDASEPEERTLDPYVIAYGEGQWYAIGHSPDAGGVRVFRLDRILEAHADAGTFEIPGGFDASEYVSEGRVFQADEAPEVAVRYSPRIARWIAEREEVERLEDGSVVVRHIAASPRWLVSHVLGYGAEAEVLEPVWMRELVKKAVGKMVVGSTPAR